MKTQPTISRRASRSGAVLLLAALAITTGCRSTATVDPIAQRARPYPFETDHGAVGDIQVFRDGVNLKMTNTTTQAFETGTVWVNQRYSHEIGGFTPGQGLKLDLRLFVDEFGEPFRAGGFFATKPPDKVVLVEFEPASAEAPMTGFIVVANKMN